MQSKATAVFSGLADDDIFVGAQTFGLMTNGKSSDATQYRNVAYGFSTNTANALPGSSNSRAILLDSPGDDTFVGSGRFVEA